VPGRDVGDFRLAPRAGWRYLLRVRHGQDSGSIHLRAFRDGLAAPWNGFRLLRGFRPLWRFAFLPVLFNLLLTATLLGGIIGSAVLLAGGGGVGLLMAIAFAVLGVAAVAASWFLFQAALCGFFYARLARAVERHLGARPEDLRELPVRREIIDGIRSFGRLVLVKCLVLLLFLVPVVGAPLALAGGVVVDAWFFGREFFQIPLAVRGQDRDALKAFTRRNRAMTFGLGLATLMISLVPGLSSVLLTTSVVGAVILRRRLSGEPVGAPPVLGTLPPAFDAIPAAGTEPGR
jgi:uncharacterized protein involved in cysteine biosynthesis